ncbi:MAG TPA: 30S ribosomal protein S2 [Nitrososphaeraceae archaeon]|nr:30S ribosomal protein S2 [Nitrososphaeraceae archaeon]
MFSHPDMSEDTDTTNKALNSNVVSNVEEIQQENETIESDVEEIQQENETIESDLQHNDTSSEFEGTIEENTNDESNEESSDAENLEKMILSTGIRVGTPVKTKSMSRYIIRANPEGLYILDISKTLYRIDVAAKFIGRTNIAKVAVTSAREYGKKPVEKFCEATGATQILGRFMPGTFTNPSLPKYMEPDIVIVTDPQADRQAVIEATRAGVPVIAISNSDNVISQVDLVIPANNRGRKALATVYWLLAREVMKKQGKIKSDKDMKSTIDDFETKLVEEII